ncbi:hypothetical protein B0H10DRAFT_2092423 [Mycena sp. CBHHK59/15]|nr:hypothetical protein B0H10DRAFT_2092423 [Mycena sp. CBHHK59/15]
MIFTGDGSVNEQMRLSSRCPGVTSYTVLPSAVRPSTRRSRARLTASTHDTAIHLARGPRRSRRVAAESALTRAHAFDLASTHDRPPPHAHSGRHPPNPPRARPHRSGRRRQVQGCSPAVSQAGIAEPTSRAPELRTDHADRDAGRLVAGGSWIPVSAPTQSVSHVSQAVRLSELHHARARVARIPSGALDPRARRAWHRSAEIALRTTSSAARARARSRPRLSSSVLPHRPRGGSRTDFVVATLLSLRWTSMRRDGSAGCAAGRECGVRTAQ